METKARGPARVRTRKRPPPASSSRPRRRRLVETALVVVGFIVLIDALVGDRGLVEMLRVRQDYREHERTLLRIREENARMRLEVQRLDTEAAVEDLARRELGWIKPGEKVFTLRDLEREAADPGK